MVKENKLYDVTVIGGGPVGLFTAFYSGMRQLKVKIIESMPQLGGQLAALYPEKHIYDIAGFPKVKAQELVDNLKEQAFQFDPTIVLEQSVVTVDKKDDVFELTSNTGEKHYTKTIIITAGAGAFELRRLNLNKAEQYENQNLHYFVNDMSGFIGKKVAICGGGDSAIDWALMLEPIAEEVTLIHRRNKFRAHEHSVEQLINSSVRIKTPFNITEVIGDGVNINSIVIAEEKADREETLEIDELIVNYGFVSSVGPIKEWGLELEKNSIVVNSKMETSIPGIYAAGDISTYPGKVKLIAAGFGEAPTAVNNAKAYINPNAKVQPLHSTSIMGSKEKSGEKIPT
ncbi:NAD(P)/FAD-dependent oxidoreductase [Bacillus taeanensis]|uniref:Ferredoxin--NADP reductase n=1 Tax=Bacillus taeanensis TaxID=273032 RepID=A0A366XX21_9BACI|nr:NAD(P)/FAD-dependent oxidoreductase [Bacillus taeanensis]RBW70118.1 ferredoxin--NADP(+) reductase [Bacillus taeanensis]